MASLQVLRKRYKSIQATADMAFAMKTASSVKYARISKMLVNIEAYSRECEKALSLFGDSVLERKTKTVKSRNCMVLFSNDRGFCGGFNGELLRFFQEQLDAEAEPPLLYVYGQKACEYCRVKDIPFESFPLTEIPEYADAEELTNKLYELYESGEVNRVILIFQRYINMMTQIPAAETILPHASQKETEKRELLLLPDRETALQSPAKYCLINTVYGILLGHCSGIQAATTIAMRSACDNADKSLQKLEILINRIRQAEVTNSVIETSSYINSGG